MYTASFDRELFIEKLNKLGAFIPKKVITPCFEHIKISIGAGIAHITASDGQTQVSVYSECKSKDTFSFCVPASVFIATISLFRENEIKITVKDLKLELKSGKSKYKITLSVLPDEYPTMSIKAPTSEISLHQVYLKQALKSTEGFVDGKNPLPNLIGINIASIDKRIIFTGAVQHTICRFDAKPISINKWEPIVLPCETAKKTCSVLSDKGEVGLIHSKDKVMFTINDDTIDRIEVVSTLADILYPDAEAMLKKFPEHQITINTTEFSDALKRLKLYTLEVPRIEMAIGADKLDEMIITATDELTGKSGEEFVSIKNTIGKPLVKAFNADYVIQILKEIEDTNFIFHYGDQEKKPSFIVPIPDNENKENSFLFLISPMF